MTTRADIIGPEGFGDAKGTLIYTCNCGWIDLGHVNPKGARGLLEQIRTATEKPGGGMIAYHQTAGPFAVSGISYQIEPGLSAAEQNSVGLAIFQEVSMDYEGMQEDFSWLTSSGFSQEDLVSNLIGYNAAAKGRTAESMIREHCGKILSKAEAEKIWDETGDVSKNKNRKWEPVLHKCTACSEACPEDRAFPAEFSTIKPAKPGEGFSRLGGRRR